MAQVTQLVPRSLPGEAAHLLEIRNLEVAFFTRRGVVQAVNGVSFNLDRGERMAVVGESGSGKSVMAMSLIKLVAHPGRICGGQVLLNGQDVLALNDRDLHRVRGSSVSMVFQDPMSSLNPVMRIEDQLLLPITQHLGLSKTEAHERAIELLGMVGIPGPKLTARAYPHELSGGMRQRALIALALSCKPELLLADEPTTALDVTIQAQIVALLKDLAGQMGTAVIFITHDLGVVARFAEKVAVMYGGRIVEQGSVFEIYEHPAHPYTRGLLQSIPTVSGNKTDRLSQIPGAPPDPRDLGPGCPFAARCPDAFWRCTIERPPLWRHAADHDAACWLDYPGGSVREEEMDVVGG